MSKKNNSKKKKTSTAAVKELKQELESFKNKNISLLAEFDNYKKRTSKQIDNIRKYEGENAFISILKILDDIERVINTKNNNIDSMINGIELIKTKFVNILKDLGVENFDSLNEKFNPDFHEAIMTKKSKQKSGIVLEEYEKGYTFHDKVLRHSKVIVGE